MSSKLSSPVRSDIETVEQRPPHRLLRHWPLRSHGGKIRLGLASRSSLLFVLQVMRPKSLCNLHKKNKWNSYRQEVIVGISVPGVVENWRGAVQYHQLSVIKSRGPESFCSKKQDCTFWAKIYLFRVSVIFGLESPMSIIMSPIVCTCGQYINLKSKERYIGIEIEIEEWGPLSWMLGDLRQML